MLIILYVILGYWATGKNYLCKQSYDWKLGFYFFN